MSEILSKKEALDMGEFAPSRMYDSHEALRAQVDQLTGEVERLERVPLSAENISDFFDRNGVTCDNCDSRIVARGGSCGEHHGVHVTDGEGEALCGFCAGTDGEEWRVKCGHMEQERDQAIQRAKEACDGEKILWARVHDTEESLTQSREEVMVLRALVEKIYPYIERVCHIHLPNGERLEASEVWDALNSSTSLAEPAPHSLDRLCSFALGILKKQHGSLDGSDIQELAVEHGLLRRVRVAAPCKPDGCQCAEVGNLPGICYRRTGILGGEVEPAAQRDETK